MRHVAVVVFDEVEVLDFTGPFEVFAVCGRRSGKTPFEPFLVAENARPVLARNQMSVNPRFAFDDRDVPRPDILLVPGGFGTRREMHNAVMLDWVRRVSEGAELVLSVCTGALILGKAGLLDGLEATTHYGAYDELRAAAPRSRVRTDLRYVDTGRVITSAGVSAGIDMSLHVVARLLGMEVAQETARYMEYEGSFVTAQRNQAPAGAA
ncbi:MAG TPA: DJ-1/PfpI family protein [Gemmatimonadaceae bacterium]|nr:DJ-1/PfpI family protein [Gemmatimonadaceae bacterium]